MVKKIILLPLAIFIVMVTNAQTSKDIVDVGTAVEKLRKAMVDPDKKELESLVMDELSYGHSSGQIDDKALFVEKLVSGKSDFVSIDLVDQVITVTGNVALVRHKFNAKTNDNNRPGEVHILVLLVWKKEKAGWKLLARQAVRA